MKQEEIFKLIKENTNSVNSDFTNKILNTSLKVYGVNTGTLRRIAKDVSKDFVLEKMERKVSYEEELIFALAIAYSKTDICEKLIKLNKFMEDVDCWAITDGAVSTLRIKNVDKERCLKYVLEAIDSPFTFVKRFGYVILYHDYVYDKFSEIIYSKITDSKDYYVYMAEAWLLSECYIRNITGINEYFKTCQINEKLKKATLRKILDSRRINDERKELARSLLN